LLVKNKNVAKDIDLPGEQLKKWVVNMSKYGLNDNEKKVLSKGLNYAVTPDRIPNEEYLVATEEACKMLSTAEGEQLRAQVVGALNQAKPPKSNISKGERQALRTLAKEKSVTILPADKGKATVSMDTAEYEKKVKKMLTDEKVYEVLKKTPLRLIKESWSAS